MDDDAVYWEARYGNLLHILQASRELFTEDVTKNLGRRRHDLVRKAFWKQIDEEVARDRGV